MEAGMPGSFGFSKLRLENVLPSFYVDDHEVGHTGLDSSMREEVEDRDSGIGKD